MDDPLVSIVIPTYNSEKTLSLCLESIKRQTYKNIEVIVVDSYSQDKTVEIAERYKVKIIRVHGALLWARYLGHLYAKGDIELLLDSDQILNFTAIERGVKKILKGYDMLILEEKSYKPRTLIQWLFYFDRKHVHEIKDLDPVYGVLLARMYRYEILDNAFSIIRKKLPVKVMSRLVSHDHAIIYYEAWKWSRKVDILEDAIYHIEPKNLKSLIKKFYRYGRTELDVSRYYPKLIRGKRKPRKINKSLNSWISLGLWLIKSIFYVFGLISIARQLSLED